MKSDDVLQAVKAKWQEMNLPQVAAGVKQLDIPSTSKLLPSKA